MIAVKLKGRLGNQLFQYAFIYVAAKKMDTDFYLDQEFQKSIIHKYFQIHVDTIDLLNSIPGNTGIYRKINTYLRKRLSKLLIYIYQLNLKVHEFPEQETGIEYKDRTLYIGYFQSPLYLQSYENLVRQKFTIKKKIADSFNDQFNKLYQHKTIVTIHIRRTDYKNMGHLNLGYDDLSLPLSYYHNALSQLAHKKMHYIFISDDIDFVKENFGEVEPKTISTQSEICDFQHLLHSNICIISNSSFSWWGAWLNNKPAKIIYCPKYYLGYHMKKQIPHNIYPKEWRQIEFN